MKAEFKKDSAEYKMMADYYNLMKDFWGVEESGEYWTGLVEKTDEFIKKHEEASGGFSRRLGYAFVCRCEEIYYEGKKNKEGELGVENTNDALIYRSKNHCNRF